MKDKVVIITGASSGVGRSTALALGRAGARLALAARRQPELQRVAGEVSSLGAQAMAVPTDVTRQEDVERLVAGTLERWGQVDALIACAGVYVRRSTLAMDMADVERAMAVNFYGVLYAINAVLPHMLARKQGHLVLLSTMNAKKGIPPDAPYAASKYALSGYADVLRQELHGTGVHVTTLFPGRIDSPMIAQLQVPAISAKIPPEAVTRAILAALRHPRAEVIVPFQAIGLHYLNTLSPRLGDWLVRRLRLSGWEAPGQGS